MPRLKHPTGAKPAAPSPAAVQLPGGLTLRPMSVAHVVLLQRIESPFLAVSDPGKSDNPSVGPNDILAVLYILSRSEEELDQLFSEPDRAAFHRAVLKFAMGTSPAVLKDLDKTLLDIFRRAATPPPE